MSRFGELRDALRALAGQALALDERRAGSFTTMVTALARGEDVGEATLRGLVPIRTERIGPSGRGSLTGISGAMVVGMRGVALYDLEFQPYSFSTRLLAERITEAAADTSIKTIVLDINTPGGHVTGTQEAADAVYKAARAKPVIGIINPLCASAGYWIGSQCTKLIAVPSADVGSIGVFMTHFDCSALMQGAGIRPTFIFAGEHKTEGNALEPLSASAKAFYQSEIDQTYSDFLTAVARGRGASRSRVEISFGGGRVLRAVVAQRAGMIDEIATPSAAMQSAITASNKITAAAYARRLQLEAKS